tara:strand:+ start:709 stop:1413 length:705 start_codon:yes stop_codon:yes gene_type:complete
MDLTHDDINDEIWQHLSFLSMIKLSKVSKNNKKIYDNISNSYKINKLYNDSASINNFCSKIIKYECKKFNYKGIKKKTISIIIKFIAKNELNHYIKSNNFIILYNFIILIIHSFKKNYKEIINIIKNINYTYILFQYEKNFTEIIKLHTTFVNNYFIETISNNNGKIIKLIKMTCFIHALVLSSANINKHEEFISVSKRKKKELKDDLDNIYLNDEYPKYFIYKMLKILKNINV